MTGTFMPVPGRKAARGLQAAYATAGEFCAIFHEDMAALYRLALLLTAEHVRAEKAFTAALDDCLGNPAVFREFAPAWSRRAVIKNAVRISAPAPGQRASGAERAVAEADRCRFAAARLDYSSSSSSVKTSTTMRPELCALLRLAPFDRFVFVMSVLEGYSERECALLLDSSRKEVAEARNRTLQGLAREQVATPVEALRFREPVSAAGAA